MSRRIRPRNDLLVSLFTAAREAKARERGGSYTFREMAADLEAHTGEPWSFGFVQQVITGQRKQPEPETISAIGLILAPFLDVDAALVAAGYAPASIQEANAARMVVEAAARARGLSLWELAQQDAAQIDADAAAALSRWRASLTRAWRALSGGSEPPPSAG